MASQSLLVSFAISCLEGKAYGIMFLLLNVLNECSVILSEHQKAIELSTRLLGIIMPGICLSEIHEQHVVEGFISALYLLPGQWWTGAVCVAPARGAMTSVSPAKADLRAGVGSVAWLQAPDHTGLSLSSVA